MQCHFFRVTLFCFFILNVLIVFVFIFVIKMIQNMMVLYIFSKCHTSTQLFFFLHGFTILYLHLHRKETFFPQAQSLFYVGILAFFCAEAYCCGALFYKSLLSIRSGIHHYVILRFNFCVRRITKRNFLDHFFLENNNIIFSSSSDI